mgnify:CR=1 FL=1
MKKILILTLSILLLISTASASELTSINFTTEGNYVQEDSSKTDITEGLGKLEGTISLSVAGSITGDTVNMERARGVAVSGDYAYVTGYNSDSIAVVDISTLASPSVVGIITEDTTNMDGARGVAVSGDYAYVTGAASDSIAVVDISTPSSPSVVGSIMGDATNMDAAFDVAVSGDYAYVTGQNSDSIAVVDVSTPSSPSVVGSIRDATNMGGAYGVAVSGNYAYVTGRSSDSIAVVDVSTPSSPSVVGSITGDTTNMNTPYGVAVSDDYVYVTGAASDSIAVVDVSTPSSPSVVGSITGDTTNMNAPYGVAVSGNYVYVAGQNSDSIAIVDVSNPASPSVVGSITGDTTNMDGAYGVAVSSNYAYVAGQNSDSIAVVQDIVPAYPTTPFYLTTSDLSQKNTTTWSEISGITLNQTTPANTDLKYLVSFDGRSTWKYWDGSSWQTSTLSNFQTNGMSKATLEGITPSQWSASGGFMEGTTTTLDFAVDLKTTDSGNTPELSGIAIQYTPVLPIMNSFVSNSKTTDFSTVENISAVENLTLATDYGVITFGNETVNAKAQDYDSNVVFGDCFVAVKSENLDLSFNATAYLLMNNSDGHCGDNTIFTSSDFAADAGAVKSSARICSDCELISATDNSSIRYRVPHFSSYAIGSNSNMTIDANDPKQVNQTVTFTAVYRNSSSGDFISGATCDIGLDNGTTVTMAEGTSEYTFQTSFTSNGTYTYNVTCQATGYQTLKTDDTFTITNQIEQIPEFNTLVLAGLVIAVIALIFKRKGDNK